MLLKKKQRKKEIVRKQYPVPYRGRGNNKKNLHTRQRLFMYYELCTIISDYCLSHVECTLTDVQKQIIHSLN